MRPLRSACASSAPSRPVCLSSGEQREVGAGLVEVGGERAHEQPHALVDEAAGVEQLGDGLDHVEVGRPAQRRDPGTGDGLELGRCERAGIVIGRVVGGAAHELRVRAREARRRGESRAGAARKSGPLLRRP